MEYNKLGKTEIKVSPLCLGTGSLGVNMSDRDVDALLGSYLDGGGNFLDTAHIYSDWIPGERSRSEKTLGRWLLRRGGRGNLVIGTKGAHPEMGPHVKPGPQDPMAPEELTKDLEESLSFLKTDVIDIYWLHRDGIIRITRQKRFSLPWRVLSEKAKSVITPAPTGRWIGSKKPETRP